MAGDSSNLDMIWWLPQEFWEATLRQGGGVPEQQIEQMLMVLENHTVLGVVQADISAFGAFTYFDKEKIMGGLVVEVVNADGEVQSVSHTEPADPDMRLMLDQMRPILAQAMGNLGENFYFFPLPNHDENGERFLSPYDVGQLRVTLQRGDERTEVKIDFPADSLFVPRMCQNGKPAHVSWTHCPWGGKKLPK